MLFSGHQNIIYILVRLLKKSWRKIKIYRKSLSLTGRFAFHEKRFTYIACRPSDCVRAKP